MPILDRSGWKADIFTIVPYEDIRAALVAKRPEEKLGVLVPNHVSARALRPLQDQLELIAITFPKHSDGRGFSLGRMLREQGYRGTLRASGHVLPDQFGFALRVGFDEIEVSEEQAACQSIGQWLEAPAKISERYQDTQDGIRSIFAKRRAAR